MLKLSGWPRLTWGNDSSKLDPNGGTARSAVRGRNVLLVTIRLQTATRRVTPYSALLFGQPRRALWHGWPVSAFRPTGVVRGSDGWRDAQGDMLLGEWPRT